VIASTALLQIFLVAVLLAPLVIYLRQRLPGESLGQCLARADG